MELGLIIAFFSVNTAISGLALGIIINFTGKFSKIGGQFESHRDGCKTRFEGIEDRLGKGGL